MRSLAHIEQITNIRPIDGCDNICQANVLGWNLIVKKNEFNEGDKCVYIEIDSIVDKGNPAFAFLEKKNYKIKTMKMKGTISQGIAFPMSILSKPSEVYKIGDDVTAMLKIKQVEDELPKTTEADRLSSYKAKHNKFFNNKLVKFLMKYKWFRVVVIKLFAPKKKPKQFPEWIVKTDETRLQNMPWVLDTYKNKPMMVSEKIDGTSSTYGLKKIGRNKYDFAVCSRNVRQASINQKCFYDDNMYWEMALKYNIENVLKELQKKFNATTVVLQGETIGEGVQKNKYNLRGHDFYAFNLIFDGKKVDSVEAAEILKEYNIKFVPILSADFKLLDSVDEMIAFADGESQLYPTLREGLVIRDHDNTTSFKCISNKFLLKHNL